jgi:hypothetical protein
MDGFSAICKRPRYFTRRSGFPYEAGGCNTEPTSSWPLTSEAGRVEWGELLEAEFGSSVPSAVGASHYMQTTVDDVLDAFAALWTAERILKNACLTIPAAPPLDAFSLSGESVA